MKRKNLSPADYLRNVLSTWTRFCKTHKRFANAISQVIEENERLKAEICKKEKGSGNER